jgi:NAD(P)-dependent dehydrogenase (short-subunit alcohol dehydrogenase family)
VPSGEQGRVNIPEQEGYGDEQFFEEQQQEEKPEQEQEQERRLNIPEPEGHDGEEQLQQMEQLKEQEHPDQEQPQPMETGQVAGDVPRDISAPEEGQVESDRPTIQPEQEQASQVKMEVEQGGQPEQPSGGQREEEQPQQEPMGLQREGQMVPQMMVEGLGEVKVEREGGEEQRHEESEEDVRRRLEDEGFLMKSEGIGARETTTTTELPPGPTEEERRRLERGAFIIENPIAGELMEGQEGGKETRHEDISEKPQERREDISEKREERHEERFEEHREERREPKQEERGEERREDISTYREGDAVPQMRVEGFGSVKAPEETKEEQQPEKKEHITPPHVEEVEQPTIEKVLEKLAEERGDTEPAALKEELKTELIGEEREREVRESEKDVNRLVESVKSLDLGQQQQPTEQKEEKPKLCVVLGAADWFGSECAKSILKSHKNWIVYLADSDEMAGQEAIRRLNDDYGLEARFHPLDAYSAVSLRNFHDYLVENHSKDGGIHLLISNVGLMANVSPPQGGASFDMATFQDTIRINYFGNLSACLELLPLMSDDDGRVIVVSSRFAQSVFRHSTPELQRRFRECHKIEQVNELMELILSSDMATIQNNYMADPPTTQIFGNYTLGGIYAYGIAKLGLNLLVQCYQRQFEEEKAGKRVAINAVCPGLERQDKSLGEAVDTIEWLALEQSPDSDVRGQFVADRKVIDPFIIPSDQELV